MIIIHLLFIFFQATSDALFNFPAFQQSTAWVQRKLPTFFYNFEHSGRLRGAAKLLRGSPLVFDSNQLEDSGGKHLFTQII